MNHFTLKICLIFLIHQSIANAPTFYSECLFWNTGQGQWITFIEPDKCLHFDFGGDISLFKKNTALLKHLCMKKINRLILSHPDLDHYSLLNPLTKTLPNICWNDLDHPQLTKTPPIPLCDEIPQVMPRLQKYIPQSQSTRSKKINKNTNSIVHTYKNFLIPGDSPVQQENIWIHRLNLSHIKIISLGHHGSKSSTGESLLNQLPNLKMTIVQSKYSRYGHPHKNVVNRLKIKKIPLLRTEEWGNILIEN